MPGSRAGSQGPGPVGGSGCRSLATAVGVGGGGRSGRVGEDRGGENETGEWTGGARASLDCWKPGDWRTLVALWAVVMWPMGLRDGCNFNGYSGNWVWILIFCIRFKNIHGYQVLPVSISMDTDSYPKPCPTGFLSAGTRINDIHCHPYACCIEQVKKAKKKSQTSAKKRKKKYYECNRSVLEKTQKKKNKAHLELDKS
jgi:hypothetical protein